MKPQGKLLHSLNAKMSDDGTQVFVNCSCGWKNDESTDFHGSSQSAAEHIAKHIKTEQNYPST